LLILGGEEGNRTLDLDVANVALSRLSYFPMVEPEGLEPSTFALQGRCSPKLSYGPVERVAGIEPAAFRVET
jgi:hypothetical protein